MKFLSMAARISESQHVPLAKEVVLLIVFALLAVLGVYIFMDRKILAKNISAASRLTGARFGGEVFLAVGGCLLSAVAAVGGIYIAFQLK